MDNYCGNFELHFFSISYEAFLKQVNGIFSVYVVDMPCACLMFTVHFYEKLHIYSVELCRMFSMGVQVMAGKVYCGKSTCSG